MLRRLAAGAGILLVTALVTPHTSAVAAPVDGTLLLDESFTGASVANSNIIPLNDACLTAATSNPPAGGSALGPCTK
jgi:hypothetical protein